MICTRQPGSLLDQPQHRPTECFSYLLVTNTIQDEDMAFCAAARRSDAGPGLPEERSRLDLARPPALGGRSRSQ